MYNPSIIKMQNILTNKYEDCKKRQKEITNEIQELYSLRKTDGCFYYNTSVNNNKYFMTLFYGLLPLNKADKVSLTIYDTGWIYNDFVTHFVVDKKKFKVNVILCYLKVRG